MGPSAREKSAGYRAQHGYVNGHGTFLASVAAKRGRLNRFLGTHLNHDCRCGSKACKELLEGFLCHTPSDAVCFQENDIMLGLK